MKEKELLAQQEVAKAEVKEETNKEEIVSRNLLLEAGVQFGHNTRKWNPKMKEYILEKRMVFISLT